MMRHEVAVGLLGPVGMAALIVGSVFFAWLFILAAPILLVVGLCAFLSGKVSSMAWARASAKASAKAPARAPAKVPAKAPARVPAKVPEFARDNLQILCIKGLRTEQALLERFRAGLSELWAQAPEERAVACSCVRRHGKNYYAVLRMRSKHGHSYARVAGSSIRDVGEKCIEQVDVYKRDFPIVMTKAPFENSECNRKRCHLREHSIFHNGKNLVA